MTKEKLFDRAYKDYYEIIVLYILRKTGNPDVAKDIAQDVFSDYFRLCKDVKNVKYWLFATAKYLLKAHKGKEKRNHVTLEDIENTAEDIEEISYYETIYKVADLYGSNEKEKRTFILHAEGFTYPKIAKELKITERQVNYSLSKILKKIEYDNRGKEITSLQDLLDE